MFSNLKAKKRITQLLIAIVVVALTATGSALLLNDFVQEAKAADYTVNNPTDWSNAVTSGGTVNITIGQSFNVTGRLTAIPAGTTVNLYMNGKTIQWYNASSGNTGIMSTSYPLSENYWGIITNNGTLNITGSGTIASYQVGWNTNNGSGRDNYGMRTAAIVNNGTLDVGSEITVKAFGGQANTSGNSYQDMVIYALGIYNTGTVTSSGTIHAGTIAQGVSAGSTGSNSYVSAYSYGIFGGNVNVTGGNIYSEAMSGLHENVTIPKQGNRVGNFAVGVYSNNAMIYGNANITTSAVSWRDNDSNYNTWKDGSNISWGVGVMYSGTAYPYIGADVNISASYELINGSQFSFPSLNGETALCAYTRHSSNGPSSYSRKAYPVAGVNNGLNAAMYGGQTSELMEIDGNHLFGVGTGGFPSANYRSELAAYNGLSDTASASNNVSASGSNDTGKNTGFITNGAPGNKAGGQYMVYYRYRDANNNIIKASTTPDTAINSRVVFSPANGVFTAGGTALTKTSGGDVKNSNYYEYVGTYFRQFNDGGYGTGIDCSNIKAPAVTNTGTSFTSLTMTENQIYAIWVDYKAKAPTNVKVVALNAGNEINKYTTSTTFTTEYTGNTIVPGTDFNLGVIDIYRDYDINSDNLEDNTVVTGNYAVSGTDASKIQLKYEYSIDGTTYHDGLPKDVGTYTIKVIVPSDTDINRSGSGNRNGDTFYIKGTITAATPTINGASTQTGTYGSTIAELIPTSQYTATGKGGAELSGSWSYVGYNATDYLDVGTGSKTVTLKWTPDEANKKNYNEKTLDVTVSLAKRAVTVAPADSAVNYGAKAPSYALNYTNLATCDESSKANWLANTAFEVYYNGAWQPYASTMIPGTYDMRIASFGGDTANNNFTTNGVAKLTINKAPIYYTATAENKVYDGVASVNVTLTYAAGAVNGDSFAESITTTGTLTTADAGENKEVKVVTSGLSFPNSEKYAIAIQNNPTVTIAKATPTASAEELNFEYDSNRTLNNVEINGTASVTGTWSWKGEADKITPTVDVTIYTAIFTPVNTTNYNTIEVPVTINVSKKVVTVSVENKNVSYGDASPALPLVYTGFTGTDTIDTIATTGSIAAESTYSMGKSVGTYPITITMTDYEADNYEFVAATDCVVNVAKKNITITAPSGTLTYGDNDIEYDVDDLSVAADALYGSDTLVHLDDEANFVVTTAYERGDGVGSYEVTVSASETTNYTFTFVNGYITVNKAVLTITANNAETTYGLVAPAFTYTATGYIFDSDAGLLTGKPTITSSYNMNAGDGAGQYQITITQGTLAHPNYTFKLVNGTLNVKKATPTPGDDSALIFATIIHDEAYADAIFTDTSFGGVSGTFALKDKTAIADYTAAEFEGDVNGEWSKYTTAVGIFTPSDSDNYNSVDVTVYLVIKPHAITGSPVITGTAMEGAEISASVAGMAPSKVDSYTYIWYVAGTASGTGATYTVKNSDIGKAIYVEVKAIEDKGYTGTAKSASVTASEAFNQLVGVDQLDIIGANETYIYDDNAHDVTVAVKDAYKGYVSEDITVYYNGSTSEPYKAGTYIVTIDVGTPNVPAGADRNDYYGPVSGLQIGTITIEKKAITATFTVSDKIYDGTRKVNEYNVLTNGVIEPNDVRLDVSALSIAFAKANVGEQVIEISGVKLVGNDAANYVLEINPASAVITPATLTATVTGATRPYNGSATVNVTFANITGYAPIDSSATVYFAQATATATSPNAGTQGITNIRYELGGTSAGNYIVEITNLATATVTITKATPNVTAPTVGGLVYDANRTLANIVLTDYYVPDSNGYWQFDDTSVVPTVKRTAYEATYVSQNANYADLKTTITVNVTPKEVTLTAQDTTVSYGKAASFSVKADGFTGNDSLATMGGTQPTYVCSYYVGQPVGKYTVGINHNLDSNGNYTFKTVGGTLTVVPAELYVSATATNRDYNGSTGVEVKFAITSGKYSSDDVSLSTTTANGIASSANAGTRTVTYTEPTLTGSKASNYTLVLTPASGILTVTINKLNPEGYVFPKTATIEFGQALSWAEFSDDAQGDGTFALVGDVPNELGEYAYEVVFTPSDSVNYNKVTGYVRLTVVTCTVSYQVAIGGTAQVGEKLSTVFTGLPSKAYEHVKYQWYRVADGAPIAINGANSSTYAPVEADVGYAIVCVTYFDNTAPFQIAEDIVEEFGAYMGVYCETDDSIEEENLTFWQRLVKWIQSIIEALTGLLFIMG